MFLSQLIKGKGDGKSLKDVFLEERNKTQIQIKEKFESVGHKSFINRSFSMDFKTVYGIRLKLRRRNEEHGDIFTYPRHYYLSPTWQMTENWDAISSFWEDPRIRPPEWCHMPEGSGVGNKVKSSNPNHVNYYARDWARYKDVAIDWEKLIRTRVFLVADQQPFPRFTRASIFALNDKRTADRCKHSEPWRARYPHPASTQPGPGPAYTDTSQVLPGNRMDGRESGIFPGRYHGGYPDWTDPIMPSYDKERKFNVPWLAFGMRECWPTHRDHENYRSMVHESVNDAWGLGANFKDLLQDRRILAGWVEAPEPVVDRGSQWPVDGSKISLYQGVSEHFGGTAYNICADFMFKHRPTISAILFTDCTEIGNNIFPEQPGESMDLLALNPTRQMLAVSTDQHRVYVYEWEGDSIVATTILGREGAVCIAPSSRHIYRHKPAYVDLAAHSKTITGLTFNGDGSLLVSSSHDRTVVLTDVSTMTRIRTLTHHRDAVLSIDFDANTQLLSTSYDQTAVVVDVETWSTRTLDHNALVRSASFYPSGRFLCTCCQKDLSIYEISGDGCKVVHTFQPFSSDVLSAKWCPTGPYLIAISSDCLAVFHTTSWQRLYSMCDRIIDFNDKKDPQESAYLTKNNNDFSVKCVDCSPCKGYVAVTICGTFHHDMLAILDLQSQQVVETLHRCSFGGWGENSNFYAVAPDDGFPAKMQLLRITQQTPEAVNLLKADFLHLCKRAGLQGDKVTSAFDQKPDAAVLPQFQTSDHSAGAERRPRDAEEGGAAAKRCKTCTKERSDISLVWRNPGPEVCPCCGITRIQYAFENWEKDHPGSTQSFELEHPNPKESDFRGLKSVRDRYYNWKMHFQISRRNKNANCCGLHLMNK